ncbi:hypothetical protein BH18ACT5_BH18ACT5_10100 [soil metagenome]
MRAASPILAAVALVTVIAFAVGSGFIDTGTVLLTLVLGAVVIPGSSRLGTELDPWMWWVGPAAYLAKLVGAGARYAVLVGPYEGSGDAFRYHNNGILLAESWRSFSPPPIGSGSGVGTQFVDSVTGLVYAVHQPTMLGGFFIFATLAFTGQLFFYAAFRRGVPDGKLPVYALLVFFLPALVFWPSSIGKESLMLLFLGVATYGLTRAFHGYRPQWLLVASMGLGGAAIIRPHVAALLAGAFTVAAIIGRGQWTGAIAIRRTLVVLVSIAVLGVSIAAVGTRFALTGPEDVDPFVSEIERRTQQGGSAVEGGAIASPGELPAAALRVLFRPLPTEAHNIQSLASAAENVALLGLILWRLPWMVRRFGHFRDPFVLMSAVFSLGFVIAFSTIFNLGILTRQRAQVLPFLLAAVVAVGWDKDRAVEEAEARAVILTA